MSWKEWLIIVLIGFLFGLLSATIILYILHGHWWWIAPVTMQIEVLSA